MERKYYDLTTSQRVLLYSQKYTIYKQVNNVCTSILVDQELDFDILKKAIQKAYERNDSLRIRIVEVAKDTKQYFGEHEEPRIEYLDFRGKSLEAMEKKLYGIARKRITNFGGLLSKIYMMHSHDGRCGIYFVVSHMIMDSWAISTFFKDILSIYEAIKNDSDMPKPLRSYEELLIDELNYKNTEAYKKDRGYFEELYHHSDEPMLTHLNGSAVLEKYRKKKKNPNLRYAETMFFNTKGNNIMLPVSKELVAKMEDYCAEANITMQSLVLLAFRSYLSKVNNYEEDVTINSVIARRGALQEKNTGGSRVHFFLFRTIFKENTTVKRACEIIGEKQMALYRHAELDPLEAMGIWKKAYGTPQLGNYSVASVTYQPVKLVLKNGMNVETKWYGNGASAQTFYLTVMDGDGSGGLKFYYEYQTAVISLETINKLHSFMMQFLEEGIKSKDITIGDLLELGEVKD